MKKLLLTTTTLAGALLIGSSLAYAAPITDAIVEYQGGDIVFDGNASLPTNLNFGSMEIQSTTADTRIATASGNQSDPATTGALTISDNRGDLTAGWNVKLLQQTQFVAATNEEENLDGATLTIYANPLDSNLATNGFTGELANTETGSEVRLMPGTTHTMLNAEGGAGMGETSVDLTQFELEVPANTKKIVSEYQTKLNWTVSTTPVNE